MYQLDWWNSLKGQISSVFTKNVEVLMKKDEIWEPNPSQDDKNEGFDAIENPSYYTQGCEIQPRDLSNDWGLTEEEGDFVKYMKRAGKKDDELLDVQKGRWNLQRALRLMENPVKGTLGITSWDAAKDWELSFLKGKALEQVELSNKKGGDAKNLRRAIEALDAEVLRLEVKAKTQPEYDD
ncbi:hypothetical protein LCGC14_0452220 [marine sediment metagenome]|uniref:Uncharacterized protein n=1 Tax=marine sediment metagenome TaxID=412755 RepID=A0A0F9V4B7_9ZZZZ